MGRRLRPLDPDAGAVERFACELRALRAMAGDPPFWKMARRCHVSKSALADAVAGRNLPTENVARAFVEVCRGDWQWWRDRLQRLREPSAAQPGNDDSAAEGAGRSAALLPARPLLPEPIADRSLSVSGAASLPDMTAQNHPGLRDADPGARARRFRRRLLPATVVIEAVVIAVLAFALATYQPGSDSRLTVSVRPPLPIDGADPYTDGCGADEQAIQRQGIVWPDGTGYGWLTMFYSHKCQASWGSVAGPNSTQWRVYIVAHRSADNASAPSSYSGDSPRPGSWGNLLLTTKGCVWVEAYITKSGIGRAAKTDCYQETVGPVLHSSPGGSGSGTTATPVSDSVRSAQRSGRILKLAL